MEPLHLRSQLLDRELIDREFVSCGKIDDLELKSHGAQLEITAILAGPGAWARRLPALIRWLVWHLVGRNEVRIPWDEVKSIGSHVQLRSLASDLGLNTPDERLAKPFRRIPGGA